MEEQSNPSNDDASKEAIKEEAKVEDTKANKEVAIQGNKEVSLPSINTRTNKSLASSFDSAYSASLESTVRDLSYFSQLAPYYVKSSLSKHKNENDFIVAAIAGKELKLSLTQSINNVISIQGTATLPVNLIKALLIRAEIIYELIEDYVPLFQFFRIDKEGKTYKDASNKPVVMGIGSIDEEFPNAKPLTTTIVDYRSTYLFTRVRKVGNIEKVITVKGSFTYQDAVLMGLATKDNYVKQPKTMVKARAFSNGAREIAPDIMMGMYSEVEMADSNDVDYHYDDSIDAETIIIED